MAMARSHPDRKATVSATVTIDKASDFLDAISPRSPELTDSGWIFRGHAKESYTLVPLALRKPGIFKSRYFHDGSSMETQIKAEFKLLAEFFAIADSHGVLPPDVGNQLNGIFDSHRQPSVLDDISAGRWSWIPDELLYLAAVAQHHGLPTRLLDWTQHPFIAAYFAAHSLLRLGPAPRGKLVVWAFNVDLHESEMRLRGLKRLPYQPIRIINVSAAGNANLHAQRGVFTLFRPERIELGRRVDRTPLDKLMATVDSLIPGQWAMKRFTLPASQAGELTRLLRAEGITAARLFPGLGGVVSAMRDYVLARV